jgi:hypothetical protein
MGLYRSAPGLMGTQLNEEPERLPIKVFIETLGIYLVSPRHASNEGCKLAKSKSRCGILRTSRIPEAPARVSFLPSTKNSLQAPGLEPTRTASE